LFRGRLFLRISNTGSLTAQRVARGAERTGQQAARETRREAPGLLARHT
jgi:hypothetical protein